jgi:hypothetical protein
MLLLLLFLMQTTSAELIQCTVGSRCCPATELEVPQEFDQTLVDFTGPVVSCHPVGEMLATLTTVNESLRECVQTPPPPPPPPERNLYTTAITTFPRGCGYRWQGFNVGAFRQTRAHYLRTGQVLCGGEHHSMCTSATYLVLAGELQRRYREGRLSRARYEELIAFPQGDLWDYLNYQARPDLLMTETDPPLGTSRVLRRRQLPDPEWPRQGDLVQITRQNGFGHSVVFADYLRENGQVTGLCYWSSNSPNGYGRRCESLAVVQTLAIGRLNP